MTEVLIQVRTRLEQGDRIRFFQPNGVFPGAREGTFVTMDSPTSVIVDVGGEHVSVLGINCELLLRKGESRLISAT